MGAFSKFKELVGKEASYSPSEFCTGRNAAACVSVRFERKTGTFWQQIYQRHEDGRHRTPGIR